MAATFESPYSDVSDLILGDVRLGGNVDKDRFVRDGAREIDSRLGPLYALPLAAQVGTQMPDYVGITLKRINNNLATGRIILAVGVGGEDNTLHAYGAYLVKEAQNELELMASGQSVIPNAVPSTTAASSGTGPSISGQDVSSGVEAFYDFAMKNPAIERVYTGEADWQPGSE